MNQEELKQSAGILALTRVRNQIINGLPDEYRPIDEAEAYQVQKQLHARSMKLVMAKESVTRSVAQRR